MGHLTFHSEFLVRRLPNGRREFTEPFIHTYHFNAGPRVDILIPPGFDTNYSSWKGRWPGPDYSRIDVAGVDHDYIWRYGYLGAGLDAEPVGFVEGNRWWWRIARAGTEETRCNAAWAAIGISGLMLGGWISWLAYRGERKRYAEELRARKKEAGSKGPDGDEGPE